MSSAEAGADRGWVWLPNRFGKPIFAEHVGRPGGREKIELDVCGVQIA